MFNSIQNSQKIISEVSRTLMHMEADQISNGSTFMQFAEVFSNPNVPSAKIRLEFSQEHEKWY